LRKTFLILNLACSPLWSSPQVYFSPGGVQKHLVTAIDATTQTLDVAVYELSSKSLIAALKHAGERGVVVRVLLDEKVLKEHREDKSLAALPNITLRTLSGRESKRGMMHNKFAIFDESRIVTGSYNWSQGAEVANYENAIFEEDPEVVRAYSGQFADLWARAKSVSPGSDLFSSHSHRHYH
jgi:cardiolipin hydrolase